MSKSPGFVWWQRNAYSCGPIALLNLLKRMQIPWSHQISFPALVRLTRCSPENGTLPSDLKAAILELLIEFNQYFTVVELLSDTKYQAEEKEGWISYPILSPLHKSLQDYFMCKLVEVLSNAASCVILTFHYDFQDTDGCRLEGEHIMFIDYFECDVFYCINVDNSIPGVKQPKNNYHEVSAKVLRQYCLCPYFKEDSELWYPRMFLFRQKER